MIEPEKVSLVEDKRDLKSTDTEKPFVPPEPVKVEKKRTAYAIFMSENGSKCQNMGKNFMKEMAKMWKELDEDEKKIYHEKARIEKEAVIEKKVDKTQTKASGVKSKFSVYKMKNIIKEDPKVFKRVKPETLEYLCEVTEVFSKDLLNDVYSICQKKNQKKLTEDLFNQLKRKNFKYRFLTEFETNKKVDKSAEEEKKTMQIEMKQEKKRQKAQDIADSNNNNLTNYFKLGN